MRRLRTLEATGVIERRVDAEGRGIAYHLTDAGRDLGEIVLLLGDWGQRWANVEISEANLDPDLLIWDMHRRLDTEGLPQQRLVVRIDLTGAHRKSYWLVMEQPTVSVCWTDPGFDVDLEVSADTVALHRVWVGQLDLKLALRDRLIELEGPAPLRRAFPQWLKLSIYTERGSSADRRQHSARPFGSERDAVATTASVAPSVETIAP